MSISEELERLGALHQRGALSDDEFVRAKARVLSEPAGPAARPPLQARLNALHRVRAERWLGGVCAGLGQACGLAAWIWRLLFVLLVLCGGTGVALYLLLWLLVPLEAVPGAGHPGPVCSA